MVGWFTRRACDTWVAESAIGESCVLAVASSTCALPTSVPYHFASFPKRHWNYGSRTCIWAAKHSSPGSRPRAISSVRLANWHASEHSITILGHEGPRACHDFFQPSHTPLASLRPTRTASEFSANDGHIIDLRACTLQLCFRDKDYLNLTWKLDLGSQRNRFLNPHLRIWNYKFCACGAKE